MGNFDSKIFRVCGSALKTKKGSPQEIQEEEVDNNFIERNRDKYFQKDDYKKIIEKFPEYKEWMEQSTVPQNREKHQQKRIRWKQGEVIGHGSFGKVVMGLNLQTGCMMAVKQVQIGAVNTAAQQDRIQALEVEIELLSQFSHKNIVRYYGSDRSKDTFNIFLEYISGGTIASLLDKYGPFNENLIRVYTRQILQGLEYLHVRNTIHRDIKGANVLVDNSGICKLTDFGTAKRISSLVESESKYVPSIRGTVNWMAPEVIRQTNLGRYCDIWSVGCTVIEMATGKAPWSTFFNQNASCVSILYQIAQAKSPPPFPKGLSNEALDFLRLCFKINPQERPNVLKLLNHRFLSSVVFYKHIDLPMDPKHINPKVTSEQQLGGASSRRDKYAISNPKHRSASSNGALMRDTQKSPELAEDQKEKPKKSNFVPKVRTPDVYLAKEEPVSRPVVDTNLNKLAMSRKISSTNEISNREDRSKVDNTEIKGLAPSDISEIESPAILHNLTDRFKTMTVIEDEKDKTIVRTPVELRGQVRSRPLGKNNRLLLKKGYANLSEDESIVGNSMMLVASPDTVREMNDGQTASNEKGNNKSSLFKLNEKMFPWPESLGDGENGGENKRKIEEEKEEVIIESDKEESELENLEKSGKRQQRRESVHNLSNGSVHSNPEVHTVQEVDEKMSINNKENFDKLFGEEIKPLPQKKIVQEAQKIGKANSHTNLQQSIKKEKFRSPGIAYSSDGSMVFYGNPFSNNEEHWKKQSLENFTKNQEERGRVYKINGKELEEKKNRMKRKISSQSLTPKNMNLIDD